MMPMRVELLPVHALMQMKPEEAILQVTGMPIMRIMKLDSGGERQFRAMDKFEEIRKPQIQPRAWTLGRHYKWIDVVSLLWVGLITILFVIPLYTVGLPWNDPFDWRFTNYTILWFAGIGLVFGGWWFISARHWFKGPIHTVDEPEPPVEPPFATEPAV